MSNDNKTPQAPQATPTDKPEATKPADKEPWMNALAMTTVVLAVAATLSTFKGGGYSTSSILFQSQASDQWAYYQAKSVKLNLYDLRSQQMEAEMELARMKSGSKETNKVYEKTLAQYREKVETYKTEQAGIKAKAESLEAARDDARQHSKNFGQAVVFLQLAILLSSMAALLKKRNIWLLGVGVGAVGLVYFLNGFLVLF